MTDPVETCFHCGLPVETGQAHGARINGQWRAMCCAGCAAVAEAIDGAGLDGYYRHRTARPLAPVAPQPGGADASVVYDDERVQATFVEALDDGMRRAHLVVDGVHCPACIWLNERHLAGVPGVADVSIHYATRQARITYDGERLSPSGIFDAIRAIGYDAHPFDPVRRQALLEAERRDLLKKLGVAAAFGMQVMILAVALYAGDWQGMDADIATFLRRASALLTLPVLLYAGSTFFAGAWRDLRLRRVGMDVPVSLGIGLAFAASTWHVAIGAGEVYFESVCMFVFFLLGARYLELANRRRALVEADAVAGARPASARRLHGDEEQRVAAAALRPGDRVRVSPGEIVPADGVIAQGRSGLDESLLTGESTPRQRREGQEVLGGSVNIDSPLVVEVRRTGDDSLMARIARLADQALGTRPALSRVADRVATVFVLLVLGVAATVAGYWWMQGSPDWLRITVAVLVVSCPCALSLAVPSAISAAIGALFRDRVLTTSADALTVLSRATLFVFDKTGTLTRGKPQLVALVTTEVHDQDRCLAIAAALEQGSEHPLAGAVRAAADTVATATELVNRPGAGVQGTIDGIAYRLGTRTFVGEWVGEPVPGEPAASGGTEAWLASRDGLLARLSFSDPLRDDADRMVAALRRRGLRTALASGDNLDASTRVARQLGIDEVAAPCDPADKLSRIRAWQAGGDVVVMVGDGVNDAPVLAGADVAISTAGAAAISVGHADIVLLDEPLVQVVHARDMAVKTVRVLRQNLAWALCYNLGAIPAAAMGLVPPWLAALGMSLSSLVVIGNASRLRRRPRPQRRQTTAPATVAAGIGGG